MATANTRGPIVVKIVDGIPTASDNCCDGLPHELVSLEEITDDVETTGCLCNICWRKAISSEPKLTVAGAGILAHVHAVTDREMGHFDVETFLFVETACPTSPDGKHELVDLPENWWGNNQIKGAKCKHCGASAETYWDRFAALGIGDEPVYYREEDGRRVTDDTRCVIPGRAHDIRGKEGEERCIICNRKAVKKV